MFVKSAVLPPLPALASSAQSDGKRRSQDRETRLKAKAEVKDQLSLAL